MFEMFFHLFRSNELVVAFGNLKNTMARVRVL